MSEKPDKNNKLLTPRNLEVHSDEVNEILGYIPHWLVRAGILIIALTIMILLIGSYFYKYPDIVTAEVEIMSEIPPAIIKAKTSGKIMNLLVSEKQKVAKGKYLVVLENTADYRHVAKLKEQIDSLRDNLKNLDQEQLKILCNQGYFLGELQSDYENFLRSSQEFLRFYEIRYHEKKINAINENIKQTHIYKKQLQNQMLILKKEYDLVLQEHKRKETLLNKGLISAEDFDRSSNIILQKEYSLEGANIQITNATIQISNLKQSKLDLELDYKEKDNYHLTNLSRACNDLYSRILIWEQTYILKANSDGIVSLSRFWSVDQNVSIGDNVVAIIPEKVNKIIGKINLPVQGSGKVIIGQTVNIKLLNYPHMEYGMVSGVVISKSLIAENQLYVLTVDFPEGLITNYRIDLIFDQNLTGTADIITNDIRLLERLINPPKSLVKENIM